MKNYFKIKNRLLFVFFILFQCVASAQTGLNKDKDELLKFIKRPAYSFTYSEVTIDDNSITTFTKDYTRGIYYRFNSYNRCNGEVMSERLNATNYENTLSFLKGYLQAMNYVKDFNSENSYKNTYDRIIATIEQNDKWLNIVFKKY